MGVPNDRSHVRTSPVTISIGDLFANVNSKDIDFLKYIPDEFLNDEQIQAKELYLAKAENNSRVDNKNATFDNTNTPSVTESDSSANKKTSNSQTSEKKSKGKTADAVYEKGKKIKVGDKVGEVTLVADKSGAPVTPVLRASFDRTDIPSYIMATVESTGDKALITALEEETALMMMGELVGDNAQLPLHDAIESLSEHVRDGNITPEQAARILSSELANPTGADVDTLVERENMAGVRYSIGYTTDNNPIAIVEDDILDGVSEDKWIETVKDAISEKFSEGIPISGRLVKVNMTTRREFTGSKNTQYYKSKDRIIYEDKLRSANNLDDIMLASTNYINEDLNHKRKDNFVQFARGDVLLHIGNNDYAAKVIVGYTSGNQMVLYDIVDFVKTSISLKKVDMRSPSNSTSAKNSSDISTNNTIPQSESIVNSQYMQKSGSNTESDENSFEGHRYSLGSDTDTVPLVDYKRQARFYKNLAQALYKNAKTNYEKEVLSRFRDNAEKVAEEYSKLHSVNSELQKMMYAKGKRDELYYTRMNELKDTKDKINQRLNEYEKDLRSVKAAQPIRDMIGRSTSIARKSEHSTAQEKVNKIRSGYLEKQKAQTEKKNETIKDIRHAYYERQKARTQSRHNTETKNKTLREIQKLRRRVENPTKSRNVVNGMQDAETRKAEAQKKTASESETGKSVDEKRYLINENFSNNIEEWVKDGCPDGERFVLGMTGDVLQGLGAIESDIYMNSDKINTILSDHPEITIDEIKKIPQILDDPVLILKSQNKRNSGQNTRLVIFSSIKGQNGKPVLSVMDLRPVENNFVIDDMQKVSSAYTKTTSPVEFVKNGDVLYADKKRTTSLLRTIGFQMPIELRKSGYIGSISYVGQNVNIAGEKFDKVFSLDNNDMQDSKKNSSNKSKTSNSQTSEKKSKGKTADAVYEKGKKIKVGDKVGEVTLVADKSGAPVTPVLRASFDRTDIPSYIMATVESTGDKALITALEEETALMMMGELVGDNAQLPMHDAIESLSEHVRDGNITPEQAARILSSELSNPTGADVDTLVERENMASVRYSFNDYDKPITDKDVEVLRTIEKMDGRPKSISQFTSEDIDKSSKWAYKFYNEIGVKSPFFRAWFGDWRAKDVTPITVATIPTYEDNNESRKKQRGDVINNDTATNKDKTNGWNIRISREGETNTISHAGKDRRSEYGLSGIRSLIENAILLDSEVHEHHSNNAKNDLISFDHKLYALGVDNSGVIGLYKITVEEYYQSKKQPSNKRFHNLRYIEKIADVPGGRTFDRNRSGGSTIENSTINYSISDLFKLVKQYDKDFHYKPVDPVLLNKDGTPKVFYHGTSERFTAFSTEEIASREGSFFFAENREDAEAYGDNVFEVYLQGKNLADYDNQPSEFYHLSDKRAQVEYGYDGWYADMDSDGWGELSVFSPGQIKSANINIGTFDETNSDIRYSISLPDTDTAAVINREARAKNIVALAEGLQSVAESSREQEALERYKRNANILARQYEQLNKLTAEYRELNNAPERDVDKLKVKREEIRALNESIDTNESGLKASRVTDTIRNMVSRSVRRQDDEISRTKHRYYQKQKAHQRCAFCFGGPTGTRTPDRPVMSR